MPRCHLLFDMTHNFRVILWPPGYSHRRSHIDVGEKFLALCLIVECLPFLCDLSICLVFGEVTDFLAISSL